jgi:hypothetical protein
MSVFTKKTNGSVSLKRILLVLLTGLAIGYIPYAAAAWWIDAGTDSNRYAAILLSADAFTGHDHWAPPIAFLGSYPSWSLYFNAAGLKPDYIFSATKNDFIRVLKDEKYQSIVLVGHGSFNCWKATDELVDNQDVVRIEGAFNRKNGEWFQLSCPLRDYSARHLGEMVMSSSDRVYYYSGDAAGIIDFVMDALFGFSHIKAETGKARGER